MHLSFDLQGHRGARGLKPENTLPSFEMALDLKVTSIETDVHLSADDVPVLCHDPFVHSGIYRRCASSALPDPADTLAVRSLSLRELRDYRADGNPDVRRHPRQDPGVTPLAAWFGRDRGFHPYAPPSLKDLFDFVDAYAGEAGAALGKHEPQRSRARVVRFDLELKRVPFHPEFLGEDPARESSRTLEHRVIATLRETGVMHRTTVRSFDHQCVRYVIENEPQLPGGVLVADSAPIAPASLARQAGARMYCPDYRFMIASHVSELRSNNVSVLPWTVNNLRHASQLISWGVDGLTTDYPDRMGELLAERGISF